jgi:hypothetical protein
MQERRGLSWTIKVSHQGERFMSVSILVQRPCAICQKFFVGD